MESEFMKKLKEYKQEQEHPIVEELKNIPDDKRVNPPPLEESMPEPEEEKQKSSTQVCPTCQKEFKHLSRHKCKIQRPITTKDVIEEMAFSQGVDLEPEVNYIHTEEETETSKSDNSYQVDLEVIPESGIELFIDAIELHNSTETDFHYLIEFLKPVTDAIEKENNIEHWSLIDYGKGCGILCTRLERYLKSEKPGGIVYLDSATKEGQACKEVLKRYARRVVQGVR